MSVENKKKPLSKSVLISNNSISNHETLAKTLCCSSDDVHEVGALSRSVRGKLDKVHVAIFKQLHIASLLVILSRLTHWFVIVPTLLMFGFCYVYVQSKQDELSDLLKHFSGTKYSLTNTLNFSYGKWKQIRSILLSLESFTGKKFGVFTMKSLKENFPKVTPLFHSPTGKKKLLAKRTIVDAEFHTVIAIERLKLKIVHVTVFLAALIACFGWSVDVPEYYPVEPFRQHDPRFDGAWTVLVAPTNPPLIWTAANLATSMFVGPYFTPPGVYNLTSGNGTYIQYEYLKPQYWDFPIFRVENPLFWFFLWIQMAIEWCHVFMVIPPIWIVHLVWYYKCLSMEEYTILQETLDDEDKQKKLALYASGLTPIFPEVYPEHYRRIFNDLPLPTSKSQEHHTHGDSAADRSSASAFADQFSALTGRTAYFFQRSRADERHERQGSREYYWAKDMAAEAEDFDPPQHPVLVMVDVDQYVDLSDYVSLFCPILLYTFQPDRVARDCKNYSYYFDDDGKVYYRVTGGATYIHEVWDYSQDCVVLPGPAEDEFTSYLVDRRQTSPDHYLILLTPLARWTGNRPDGTPYQGLPLTRLRMFQNNGFNVLRVHEEGGMKVSIGLAGSMATAYYLVRDVEACALVSKNNKHPLNATQIITITSNSSLQDAAVLIHYLGVEDHDVCYAPVACPVTAGVRRYQFKPSTYDPSAKPSLIAFMQPIVHGAFSPDQTKSNEEQAIQERITRFATKEVELKPFFVDLMREFTVRMIPKPNKLHPTTIDEVYDRQAKPTQRSLLEKAEWMNPKRIISSFLKKEAYPNVKDPRVISTINTPDKRDYSQYMYVFADEILKKQPWYAGGKTPLEIAQRVASVCQDAKVVVNTDFSRFDGHVGSMLRHFEQMAFLRAFEPTHHSKLLDLLRSQYSVKGYAPLGTKYDTGYARASGSPETSSFNSMDNAFMAYVMFRFMGHGPDESFSKLGVYSGDDGLTPDADPESYRRAATSFGQDLDIELIKRGCYGVKFLARLYGPGVWEGIPDSICDVKRTIEKFHTTVALPSNVTELDKFYQKIMSLALTDRNTPIISQLINTAMTISDTKRYKQALEEKKVHLAPIMRWVDQFDCEEQYPNNCQGWADAYVTHQMPDFRYDIFLAWLQNCTQPEDVLTAPLCILPSPAVTKIDVVVDGEIVKPKTTTDTKTEEKKHEKKEEKKEEKKNGKKDHNKLDDAKSKPPRPLENKHKQAYDGFELKDCKPPVEQGGDIKQPQVPMKHVTVGEINKAVLFGNVVQFDKPDLVDTSLKIPLKTECIFFSRSGHCKLGDKCGFKHSVKIKSCKYSDANKPCPFGPKCKFAHTGQPVLKVVKKHGQNKLVKTGYKKKASFSKEKPKPPVVKKPPPQKKTGKQQVKPKPAAPKVWKAKAAE